MFLFLILCILLLFATLGFVVFIIQYGLTLFYGAPYVKSSDKRLKKIIKLLDPKPGEKIIDLGSGDGKILFDIVKKGATAYGVEVNPYLVWRTKQEIKNRKLSQRAYVKRGNLFNENLSKYDKVVIYGITYIMPKLEKKLQVELKPGTIVVSNYFELPQIKPVKKVGDVLLYKIN